jgi:hypothetical protein
LIRSRRGAPFSSGVGSAYNDGGIGPPDEHDFLGEDGLERRFERYHPDMEAMHHGFRTESCFVCRMVDGDIGFPENLHWHVVPLPPGVPYEEQQGAWASWGMGVLKIPQQVMASLATRIGRRFEVKT